MAYFEMKLRCLGLFKHIDDLKDGIFIVKLDVFSLTLPKTNMEPEHDVSQKEFHLPMCSFLGFHVSSGGLYKHVCWMRINAYQTSPWIFADFSLPRT